ncbi:MAG: peptidoglycan DD-metalloendopeptidase family protein [Endomicrobia bacterium]|nr:peptidoglycan DD-metalloendopeptidase family protein [Endomicrobiia bacterium]
MKKTLMRIIIDVLILAVIFSAFFFILRAKISRLEYVPMPPQYELDIEKVVIKEGDKFSATFKNTRLSNKDTSDILKALKKNVNINRSMPGDFYEVLYSSSTREWSKFWYYPSGKDFYSLSKSSDGAVVSQKKSLAVSSETFKKSGTIESSLWESMSAAGIPADIILSFADIFAWQMDFLTDTRKGDTFKVIYEIETVSKKDSKLSARIIAAQYGSGAKIFNAVLFKTPDGKSGYFDENGKSVKSAFLKAPLQFSRISSYFSASRMHPILKIARPHLGIDYVAPAGTPVSAIGDGTVIKSAYSGGDGNFGIVKNSNGYETHYGHLSKYGRGIRKGVRVSQGQVIGYVGSTGLSTGPHLDFRIARNGSFFNFLNMKTPPNTELKGKDKEAFNAFKDTIFAELPLTK